MILPEIVVWMWFLWLSFSLSLSYTHTDTRHTASPKLPPKETWKKWIIASWFDKNWAAWRGSCWPVRKGPYGGSEPTPICQLRLLKRRFHRCGTWSLQQANYTEWIITILYLFFILKHMTGHRTGQAIGPLIKQHNLYAFSNIRMSVWIELHTRHF